MLRREYYARRNHCHDADSEHTNSFNDATSKVAFKQADNQFKAAIKPDKKARRIMIIFTILGFMTDGQRYVDFNFDVCADTPVDAIEKALRQHSNLVVSSVVRAGAVRAR